MVLLPVHWSLSKETEKVDKAKVGRSGIGDCEEIVSI